MSGFEVAFRPSGRSVPAEPGDSLLDCAAAAGLIIDARCGGSGTCGKCLIKVVEGSVLTDQLDEAGPGRTVLACRSYPLGDCVLAIPESARSGEEMPQGSSGMNIDVLSPPAGSRPILAWQDIELPEPTTGDNISDDERLTAALSKVLNGVRPLLDDTAFGQLPVMPRTTGWKAGCLVDSSGGEPVIRALRPFGGPPSLGLAFDIGTTTVHGRVIELATGRVLASEARFNEQASCGEDVISRIVFSARGDGLARLTSLIRQQLGRMCGDLLTATGFGPDAVSAVTLAGNTTMTHLLLGLPPDSIRQAPYVPLFRSVPPLPADRLGLPLGESAMAFVYPCVASYVGGDIVAGLLSSGVLDDPALTLFVDLGTNGEIVLGNSEWAVSAACSAGPAFEGGGMTSGGRAIDGAIEHLSIEAASLQPSWTTIGGREPNGICGTGYISALIAMLEAGLISPDGRLAYDAEHERLSRQDGDWAYTVAKAEETTDGQAILISGTDIDSLMRAKAAVFAGIRVLLESVQTAPLSIDRVLIAGGFGSSIDIERTVAIGMLPDLPLDRFRYVGNGSLNGASRLLLDSSAWPKALDIARSVTNLELSESNRFMDEYVAALFLPHTDASLFPSTGSGR